MKKLFLTLFATLFLLVSASSVMADESIVWTKVGKGSLKVITGTWVTASNGLFTAALFDHSISGTIMVVETNPDTAPTPAYDITLTNAGGIDVMGGALANLDASDTERTQALLNGNYGIATVYGRLTLNITNNSVNGASGTIKIYFIEIIK